MLTLAHGLSNMLFYLKIRPNLDPEFHCSVPFQFHLKWWNNNNSSDSLHLHLQPSTQQHNIIPAPWEKWPPREYSLWLVQWSFMHKNENLPFKWVIYKHVVWSVSYTQCSSNLISYEGAERLHGIINDMTGVRANPFFKICWLYLTPLVSLVSTYSIRIYVLMLTIIFSCPTIKSLLLLFSQTAFICSLVWYQPLTFNRWYVYPAWAYVLGWVLAVSSILLVPGLALYKVATGSGNLIQVGSIDCHI